MKKEEQDKLVKAVLGRIVKGKMKLTRPIKDAVGDEEVKEISINESNDASFYMNMPLRQDKAGDFLDIVCDLTGLTTDQVLSLHKEDYMTLVTFLLSA